MTELPAQVQRQLDEIAEIERTMGLDPDATVTDPPQPEAPVAPAAETPPAATAETPKPVDYEAKFKTLQGMFNAEVPRLNAQIREMQQQIANLTAQRAQPPAPTPAATLVTSVTSKDIESFGPELVDLIKRQSADTVAATEAARIAEVSKLTTEVAALKAQGGSVAEQQERQARLQYYGKLTELSPTWETANTDEGFKEWLAVVDPMSGLARKQYMQNAFDNHDAVRTARLFNAWIEETSAPPAAPAKTAAQLALERQVTPKTSLSSVPTPAGDDVTRIWLASEIDAFYRAVQKGEYKGDKAAEGAAIEASIDLAARTGRIK